MKVVLHFYKQITKYTLVKGRYTKTQEVPQS